MRTAPPAHYLRHNKTTRVPRNFIYLDSEAYREPKPYGEVQTFRCAVAAHDRRRHDTGAWCETERGTFLATGDLWAWISARTQARARTVLVAHNLAYDLRITCALTALPALGWTLGAIRLDRGSAWCTWKQGDRTLQMVDSFSWVPTNLERLGELVEIPKLALPDWEDSDEAWIARCERDVEILGAVWRRLVDWVRVSDLGNWRPTGAGQSWSAFRHRFMSDRILSHDNDDARTAERVAAWTGRCEVWQHGRVVGGPFSEWDYSAAYAHVGAECSVPIKLCGESGSPTIEQWARLGRKYAVLAQCTVTTDVPTVPARIDDRICWPVGTFETTLWENEVALAIEHGGSVDVSRLWWYRREPALREFCNWVLAMLAGHSSDPDPVVVLAAKHWSRALVGRFGARWSEWETVGRSDTSGLSLGTVIDIADGCSWSLLQVGHELKRKTAEYDSPDAVPSVMSWVMAECRVRLWELCERAGRENVVYMDTDGVIVNRAGSERLRAAAIPGLRLKGQWRSVNMLAPRQIELGGELRAAGIPRRSVKVSAGVYEGEVWQELATSLRQGGGEAVEIATRRLRLSGVDHRRRHLADGVTAPLDVS